MSFPGHNANRPAWGGEFKDFRKPEKKPPRKIGPWLMGLLALAIIIGVKYLLQRQGITP